ncbi:MAG: hypothetical protein ABI866_01585 [Dokdonella sp.]
MSKILAIVCNEGTISAGSHVVKIALDVTDAGRCAPELPGYEPTPEFACRTREAMHHFFHRNAAPHKRAEHFKGACSVHSQAKLRSNESDMKDVHPVEQGFNFQEF